MEGFVGVRVGFPRFKGRRNRMRRTGLRCKLLAVVRRTSRAGEIKTLHVKRRMLLFPIRFWIQSFAIA